MAGITVPPLTGINAPRIKPARSEARNATWLAMSWSLPRRFRGTFFKTSLPLPGRPGRVDAGQHGRCQRQQDAL